MKEKVEYLLLDVPIPLPYFGSATSGQSMIGQEELLSKKLNIFYFKRFILTQQVISIKLFFLKMENKNSANISVKKLNSKNSFTFKVTGFILLPTLIENQ